MVGFTIIIWLWSKIISDYENHYDYTVIIIQNPIMILTCPISECNEYALVDACFTFLYQQTSRKYNFHPSEAASSHADQQRQKPPVAVFITENDHLQSRPELDMQYWYAKCYLKMSSLYIYAQDCFDLSFCRLFCCHCTSLLALVKLQFSLV